MLVTILGCSICDARAAGGLDLPGHTTGAEDAVTTTTEEWTRGEWVELGNETEEANASATGNATEHANASEDDEAGEPCEMSEGHLRGGQRCVENIHQRGEEDGRIQGKAWHWHALQGFLVGVVALGAIGVAWALSMALIFYRRNDEVATGLKGAASPPKATSKSGANDANVLPCQSGHVGEVVSV